MRSSVAYLVVLMIMLSGLAMVQIHPPGLVQRPGNIAVGISLAIGAVAVALKRPQSFPIGIACALFTALGGVLSLRGWLGTALPHGGILWIVVGAYLAFRLTMNRHAEEQQRRRAAEGRSTQDQETPGQDAEQDAQD